MKIFADRLRVFELCAVVLFAAGLGMTWKNLHDAAAVGRRMQRSAASLEKLSRWSLELEQGEAALKVAGKTQGPNASPDLEELVSSILPGSSVQVNEVERENVEGGWQRVRYKIEIKAAAWKRVAELLERMMGAHPGWYLLDGRFESLAQAGWGRVELVVESVWRGDGIGEGG